MGFDKYPYTLFKAVRTCRCQSTNVKSSRSSRSVRKTRYVSFTREALHVLVPRPKNSFSPVPLRSTPLHLAGSFRSLSRLFFRQFFSTSTVFVDVLSTKIRKNGPQRLLPFPRVHDALDRRAILGPRLTKAHSLPRLPPSQALNMGPYLLLPTRAISPARIN